MSVVTAVVIGGGVRGERITSYAKTFPNRMKVVGVVEPRKFQRDMFKKKFGLSDSVLFQDWPEFIAREKFADSVIITTPDRLHKDPAVASAKKGYHILLEKPMAVSPEDCKEIVAVCKEHNVMLCVFHILRYSSLAVKIKELIDSGTIGQVVNIQLLEPVGYFHFAHSYVRGNWRNTKTSTFSLLAKCSHDFDIIIFWLGQERCTSISSFGSLQNFRAGKKPAGVSGGYCLDCPVEGQCPYSPKKIYLDSPRFTTFQLLTDLPDIENFTEAIMNSPYGRCVYDCDNDVVDNQIVNMQFEDGTTVSISMIAFTEMRSRQVSIFETQGELTFRFSNKDIWHFDFQTQKTEIIDSSEIQHGHQLGCEGMDYKAVDAFVEAILTKDETRILTGPDQTLTGHLLCFAAEKSRLENRVIDPTKEYL